MGENKKGPDWGWTMSDYCAHLLLMGKRSRDPEFQILMNVFGREKVITKAKAVLAELKDKEQKEGDEREVIDRSGRQ